MTQIEDRVRSGLRAEAEALARANRTVQPHVAKPTLTRMGAGMAMAAGAVLLVVFGGVSLLTDGGGGAASQPSNVPSTVTAASPSVPSTIHDGRFAAVPFSGRNWQLTVTEVSNSEGAYDVCFLAHPVGGEEDASAGAPWCYTWPNSDPRIVGDILGVHHLLVTDTSYVMVVQLNDEPVDRITVTGDGVDETVTPFTFPDSGAQVVAVEVPQSDGTITVSALDQNGAVVDEQEAAGRIGPLIEGTPIDDTTAASIGTMMGGEPISDVELERITGSGGFAHSGYLIESTTTADGVYELGLIVYQEESIEPGGQPVICFSGYSMTQGVNVAGGAACAPSQDEAEELAEFGLGAGGGCGPHPKEEPVVDGNWLVLAVWGIPDTAEGVTVGLGDETTVEVAVQNGVALHIWEGETDITSITFDGMSRAHEAVISGYLPIEGISDDCNASDGPG